MIADDSTVSRLMLATALRKLGHEVVQAEDGQAAWEAFLRDTFPVVITDWQMPNLDGIGLCRKVRACDRPSYTYLVVLTCLDGRMDYLEAIHAGADDFLIKPFEEDLLAARLLVGQRVGGLMTEVRQLQGLLPVCAGCKKIHEEGDRWTPIDEYAATRALATGACHLCPDCKAGRAAMRQQLTKLRSFRSAKSSEGR